MGARASPHMGARATSLVGAALGGAVGGAVAIALFLAATWRMFRRAQRDPASGRYTRWVYCQTLFLLPLLPFSGVARRIAFVNGLGLPIAIHCFYAITNYALLRELVGRILRDDIGVQQRMPAVVLLGCDAAAHFAPWGLAKGMAHYLAVDAPAPAPLWLRLCIGCFTGFFHATYCRWLTGGWDPGHLYALKTTKYTMGWVHLAWVGTFLGHLVSAWWQEAT